MMEKPCSEMSLQKADYMRRESPEELHLKGSCTNVHVANYAPLAGAGWIRYENRRIT